MADSMELVYPSRPAVLVILRLDINISATPETPGVMVPKEPVNLVER